MDTEKFAPSVPELDEVLGFDQILDELRRENERLDKVVLVDSAEIKRTVLPLQVLIAKACLDLELRVDELEDRLEGDEDGGTVGLDQATAEELHACLLVGDALAAAVKEGSTEESLAKLAAEWLAVSQRAHELITNLVVVEGDDDDDGDDGPGDGDTEPTTP